MKTKILTNHRNLLLIVFILSVGFGYSQSTQTFTTSGSFITPSGVTSVQVEAWGAGGGAGSSSNASGGGGGGAYTKGTLTGLGANANLTVTVGSAGAVGSNGGASSVNTVVANGGSAASNRTGGAGGTASAISGFVTTSYAGGAGGNGRPSSSGGNNEAGGGGGGSAFTTGTGNNGANGGSSTSAVSAGGTGTGNGGDGASGDGTPPATAGGFPGGGGGGRGEASTSSFGGAGGQVILTWTCPSYSLTNAASASGPYCGASAANMTLRSTSLRTGSYTVTYNLTGSTVATGLTAIMNFTAGSPGNGTFTTTSLSPGTTTITVTNLSSGTCSSSIGSFNTANVIVNTAPTSNAGTAVYTCTSAGAVNITAGAIATNSSSVNWTTTGTGTLNFANSITDCTYTPSLLDKTLGSVTLTLNVTGISPCGNTSSNKTLFILNPPTADAGSNVSTCSHVGAVNITSGALALNQTSILWTSSGSGTFANANNLSTCTYTPSPADITAGSVTLTLTASNAGCTDAIDTKTLTITPSTVASVSITASSTTICAGANVSFTATPTNGGTTPAYQWKVNGVNVGGNSNTYSSATLTNGNTITCVMTSNATPCLTGSPSTSNTVTMTVNPTLTAAVSIATASTTVCAGTSVSFTATPTNGGTTPVYQWKLNGTNVGTNSPTYTTTALTNGAQVTCVLTSNATPCLVGSPSLSNTLTMTVNPYVTASVSITASTTTICSGTSLTFTAIPVNGGTTPAYQWVLNGTNVGTNTNTYTSSTLTTGDQIYCILTSNATPCLLGSPTTSNTVTMTVNANPAITSTTPGSRNGTGTVTLAATTSAGTIYWYSALSGGSAIASGASFTTPSISVTTTYYVAAITSGGCTSSPRLPVVATIYTPEIDIQGNLISIADNDTTPAVADWTDFNGASSRTYTIFNTGTGILNIGAITFGGTNPTEFSITVPPSLSIAAGDNSSFTVQFTPTASGTRSAIISIVNDDAGENPYNFTIQGTGTAQEMNVQGNSVDIADNDNSPSTADWTDFSNVTTTRTFTIQNTGSITLTIGAITFTGTNPGDFSVISAPSATVIGRTQTTFTVKFTAGATGVRSAIMSIANNDSNENPYNFTIQGNTTSINMNVKAAALLIADNDTTPSTADWTDFGSTNVSSPITRTYTIENTGTANLNLTGTPKVALTGSSDFSVTTQPTSPVSASGTTTFVVRFNPTSTGTKNASISIANNDAGSGKNPYTFSITGTGVQAYTDTDGDGVFNNLDSDDDNDGIPDNIEQSYASGSVLGTQVDMTLLNETFGAGTTRADINDFVSSATTTYCYEDGTNTITTCDTASNGDCDDGQYTVFYQAGTTAVASWAPTYWYQGVDHTTGDTNGRMAIFNATNNITEEFYRTTLQGVITNAPLTYSFWVINVDRSDAPSIDSRNRPNITVEIRDLSNTIVSTINTGDIAPTTAGNLTGNWFQFSDTFIPVSTGYTIVFRNNQLGGSGNDLALDDILIKQRLTDSDQDGVADAYDLDSDNDGIGDIIEDGWVTQAGGKDTIDLTAATWVDANGNGQLDASETAYAGTGYPRNSDSDLVPNYIDLDSDNDAIFDVDEMGLINGDGDVNGDGAGEGTDVDKDGILSGFDSLPAAFGNSGKAAPSNTLGSGNYDYMKVISKTAGVYDISTSLYASLDTNNDGKIDGTADVDRDGILDAFDTNITFYGSPRDLDRKLLLDFDGRNDYGQDATALTALPNASIMAWIDLNTGFSSTGGVVGVPSFQLRISSTRNLEAIVNGTTVSSSPVLNTSQWYHVGAVYDGSTVKLYLNGKLINSGAVSGAIPSGTLMLGRNPASAVHYFKGKIDEIRVFNVALTDTQLQRMVYQEIQNSSANVRGMIVPIDVGSLPFTNVLRYYRMDTYKNDIIDNVTTASIDTGTGMKMYNHKNIYVQQAPMPFVTERTGSFATAVNSPTNDIRGLDVMDQDWSIIQVKHDITETANNVDFGMIVDSGKTITMNNNTKIQNDWYLLLNGKIDLEGKSQLVQTASSVLDASSAGSIERDQQAQSNKFNYNYLCSPVGPINTLSNNADFTVNGVLRDGTIPSNPRSITWTNGYDGAPTSPITLSNYWIFKFQNLTPQYANWASVGQNGALLPAQGFTLKGSGAATATQNYTFVGKPNNGTITTVIAPGNLNLCGNPYASAIDADAFISANTGVMTGALYFWEHYSTNSSHNLLDYQGGYSARNLVGGTPPVAPTGISNQGSSSRIPGRFIPVGQGFLVYGNSVGGTITFNNAQRSFVKENEATSNALFRQNQALTVADPKFDNTEDRFVVDNTFTKIRLGFDSANNYHRQILLGFMNEFATDEFDQGYDALQIDTQPNDLYFRMGSTNLVIEGVGAFNPNKSIPLALKNNNAGVVKFMLDATENLDANQNVFIYDNVTNQYHDITDDQKFEINLPVGIFNDRFSLRFTTSPLGVDDFDINNEVLVSFTNGNNTININNTLQKTEIRSVELISMLGQSLKTWTVDKANQSKIQIPVNNFSTGAYIVKVHTTKGDLSKKIIIK